MNKQLLALISLALVGASMVGCSADKGEATQTMPAGSSATAPSPKPGGPPGVPPGANIPGKP